MVYHLGGMSNSCGEGDDRGDRETGQGFFQIGELFENGNRGHTRKYTDFLFGRPWPNKRPIRFAKVSWCREKYISFAFVCPLRADEMGVPSGEAFRAISGQSRPDIGLR